MIRIGIIGDKHSNLQLIPFITQIRGIHLSGIYYTGKEFEREKINYYATPTELIEHADLILLLNEGPLSSDFLKIIMRRSKHLYIRKLPEYTIRELRELNDLCREAEIAVLVQNKLASLGEYQNLAKLAVPPLLLNLQSGTRTTSSYFFSDMFDLVRIVNQTEKSSYRKLDVFGLKNEEGGLTLHIRIEFPSSSVYNLTYSNAALTPGYCLFQNNLSMQKPLPHSHGLLPAEKEALLIRGFIRSITRNTPFTPVFDDLLQATQLIHEIKEKLKYNGIEM